jgi:hypothetical protein
MAIISEEQIEMSAFEELLAKAEKIETPTCNIDSPNECLECGS